VRLLLRVLTVSCFCLHLAACGRETPPADEQAQTNPERASIECQLTMGWDPWPPFHYTGFGGELTGFDIDLLRAMAAEAGCELAFERDSWASLISRIREGSIDLVTGATMTDSRRTFAHFSDPVRQEQFALFIRTGEANRWRGESLREMMEEGMRLGVTDAYVYDDSVHEILDDPDFAAQVVRSRFGEANLGHLLEGEIDAFVEDLYAATSMIRRLGFEGAISRHRLRLGDNTEVRIMYSKETVPEELVTRLNDSLARLKESGEYTDLQQRHLD
jgi:polar amino acid transport system substrate-binding protein